MKQYLLLPALSLLDSYGPLVLYISVVAAIAENNRNQLLEMCPKLFLLLELCPKLLVLLELCLKLLLLLAAS